ncbi:MAG: hypothetical protein JNM85_08690 [Chthonomonas sp.]|nr:hypothetical protein [Chthonomonas sp.]
MNGARQRASGLVRTFTRLPLRVRAARLDVARRNEAKADVAPRALAERREDLLAFYGRYEDLIEVLCDASQYGPEAKLEVRYQDTRGWMLKHYSTLRVSVLRYIEPADGPEASALQLHGRSADPFESLFAASNLEEFLREDDGNMISRIMRTRTALSLYSDHLRQQVS